MSLKSAPEKANASSNARSLDNYMSLPYSYLFIQDEEGQWFARVLELSGCMSDGATVQEAYDMVRDAQTVWIEFSLELGHSVPEPIGLENSLDQEQFFIPKSLQRKATRAAEREGVSLDEFVVAALEKAVASARS